jgi:MFS family permease
MLVNGVAPVAAPVIGGQLLRFTSWRGVFLVLAVLGLLMALSLLGLRETLPPSARHSGGLRSTLRTFRELCTDRMYVGYGLAGGFAFAAMFAYISGSPFALQNIYGLSPQAYSLVFATNALGIVAFGQVSGWLAGRFPLRALLSAGLAVSGDKWARRAALRGKSGHYGNRGKEHRDKRDTIRKAEGQRESGDHCCRATCRHRDPPSRVFFLGSTLSASS